MRSLVAVLLILVMSLTATAQKPTVDIGKLFVDMYVSGDTSALAKNLPSELYAWGGVISKDEVISVYEEYIHRLSFESVTVNDLIYRSEGEKWIVTLVLDIPLVGSGRMTNNLHTQEFTLENIGNKWMIVAIR